MRILIIGGTKFIGPALVRQLLDQHHDVVIYHRGQTEPALPASVRHIHDPRAGIPVTFFPQEILSEDFDVVIHMIAMGEADSRAAVEAFRGRVPRLVALSSGDVYRTYGRFTGLEPGPPEPGLLRENSPLRSVLYPYRSKAQSAADWTYDYEKILVEREFLRDESAVVLRLPKVYGPGGNADLATVYSARGHPDWRWTHGYVENVAAAIALAATHPRAQGIYNVGEDPTPTVGERLQHLPPPDIPVSKEAFNYDQDIAYDTRRIRSELGYVEPVSYEEGLQRTLGSIGNKSLSLKRNPQS